MMEFQVGLVSALNEYQTQERQESSKNMSLERAKVTYINTTISLI